jgi:hypothetical protein
MGAKKWPALVIHADESQVTVCKILSHACDFACMSAFWYIVVLPWLLQEPTHARVQLFATGIKTAVKLSVDCHFRSTDTPADDSALARKVCDQQTSQMHNAVKSQVSLFRSVAICHLCQAAVVHLAEEATPALLQKCDPTNVCAQAFAAAQMHFNGVCAEE